MKRLLAISLFQLCWISVSAVSQYTDRIVLDEKKYPLYSNPLETFFTKEPARRLKENRVTSELWRGYIATFTLKNKRLTVTDMLVQHKNEEQKDKNNTVWNSVLDSVFKSPNERFCDWYTGYLIIPTGKLVKKASTSYASVYEKFILLTVSKGLLTSEKSLTAKSYEDFLDNQFKSYSKTREYRQASSYLPHIIKSGKEKDEFLKLFVDEYASKIYDN